MSYPSADESLNTVVDLCRQLSAEFLPELAIKIVSITKNFNLAYRLSESQRFIFFEYQKRFCLLTRNWLANLNLDNARRQSYQPLLKFYLDEFNRVDDLAFWLQRLTVGDDFQKKLAFKIILKTNWVYHKKADFWDWLFLLLKSDDELIVSLAKTYVLSEKMSYFNFYGSAIIELKEFWQKIWNEANDDVLKMNAAKTLLELGDFGVVDYLLQLLNQVDHQDFVRILETLERKSISIPEITGQRFFENQHAGIRYKVLKPLSRFKSQKIRSLMEQALWDQEPKIRLLAAKSLSEDSNYTEILKSWIEEHLNSPEPHLIALALNLIARLKLEEYFSQVLALVEHPNSRLRVKAIYTLGRLNNPDAINTLNEIMLKENLTTYVRRQARDSLKKLIEPEKRNQLPSQL